MDNDSNFDNHLSKNDTQDTLCIHQPTISGLYSENDDDFEKHQNYEKDTLCLKQPTIQYSYLDNNSTYIYDDELY